MQQVFHVQHPNIDLSAPITMDDAGAKQAQIATEFAFGPPRKTRKI
jgi:hypothetical protein